MSQIDGAIEKLKLHVHNSVVRPVFPGGCPLINTVIDSDDGNPALKNEAREALKTWRRFLQGIVEQGQERNQIRSEVEATDVVAMMIALLEGTMVLDRFDPKAGFLDKAEQHIVTYLNSLAVTAI